MRAVNFLSIYIFMSLLPNFSVLAQESTTQYEAVPPKPGERCIICDMPLSADDLTLMVHGRRVPLKRAMVDSFLNNQEKYFSHLQPRSALFQENLLHQRRGVAQGGVSKGWFLFGLYILSALLFSGLSGYAAVAKGLPALRNYFIGFFFNFLGYVYVLTRPAVAHKGQIPKGLVKVPVTHAPVPCAKCGNTNHPSASKCSGCGAELEPQMQSEVERS